VRATPSIIASRGRVRHHEPGHSRVVSGQLGIRAIPDGRSLIRPSLTVRISFRPDQRDRPGDFSGGFGIAAPPKRETVTRYFDI
jgi:hypothetical protein